MDDFYLLILAIKSQTWWDIFRPIQHFFRPLQQLFIVANIQLLGSESFWLTHVLQILAHILTIFLVVNISRKLHLSLPVALSGGALFAVMSVNSVSILHIYSGHVYSTVFILALYRWWLYVSETHNPDPRWQLLVGGLTSLFALFWRETTVGPLLGIGLLTLILLVENKMTLTAVIKILVAVVAVPLVVYLSFRWLAGGTFQVDSGRYHMSLGLNVLKNVVILLGGLLYQGSTLDVFPTINPARLAIGFTLTAVLLTWLGRSCWLLLHQPSKPHLNYLIYTVIMLFCSFFPISLGQQVGEVYLYNSAPFWVLVLMLLFDYSLRADRAKTALLCSFFAVLILTQAIYALDKQSRVISLGALSQQYRQQACDTYGELPVNAILCWQSREAYAPGYSYLVQDHFNVYHPVSSFCSSMLEKNIQVLDARAQTGLGQCTYFISEQTTSEQTTGELIFSKNK